MDPNNAPLSTSAATPSPRRVPLLVWIVSVNGILLLAVCGSMAVLAYNFQIRQQQQLAEMKSLRQELAEHQKQLAVRETQSASSSRVDRTQPATSGVMLAGGSSPVEANKVTRASRRAEASKSAGDAPGSPPAVVPRPELIADLVEAIVLITALDTNGNEMQTGSGFVIDAQGLVVTNYHVLAGAASATARFRDKTTCDVAGLRAFTTDGDLAILQLKAPPPHIRGLELADDEPPAPGSEVIAIGHPGGFQFSSTEGVVSAVHATTDLPERYRRQVAAPADQLWVQTTAVIAGGSSGGPLLNRKGEVLGVNTWLAAGEKLGFAAHIKHIRPLLDDLKAEAIPLTELADPAAAIDVLVGEFNNQQQYYVSRMETAANDDERAELAKTPNPAAKFIARFLDLATRHRKTPAALKALTLACQVAGFDDSDATDKYLAQVCDRLLEDHVADPALPQLVWMIAQYEHSSVRGFLERATTNDNKTAAGFACYLLAKRTLDNPTATEAERQQANSLLERVVRDYHNVRLGRGSLGQIAKDELYEAQHLSVGCQAPEIEGEDSQGQKFKLTDFRGQVVLLDFWGNWCPHCVRMFPHERQLVESHAGRPFVILGINDDDRDTLREVERSKQVTWRSWSDGRGGPISRAWRVDGIPELVLIDHTGKIRYKWDGYTDDELDQAIAQLMNEIPTDRDTAAPATTANSPLPENTPAD